MRERTILPPEISEALKRAAMTENTASDPMARSKAIEEVLRRARLAHPECFKAEEV